MGFNPGAGGGISSASDISFSSLQDNQVLTYDDGSAKWVNAASQGDTTNVVTTSSPNMQLDYGTELPEAGNEGRFFIVIPS